MELFEQKLQTLKNYFKSLVNTDQEEVQEYLKIFSIFDHSLEFCENELLYFFAPNKNNVDFSTFVFLIEKMKKTSNNPLLYNLAKFFLNFEIFSIYK